MITALIFLVAIVSVVGSGVYTVRTLRQLR
jgi:hypothetical protein